MSVPDTHPRAKSLALRHRLVEGLHQGIVTESGLIAHGRGEAFDYLIGEKTHDFARTAIAMTSALLLRARHPVLSINGNAAALAPAEYAALQKDDPRLILEVNLFYWTEDRARNILAHLARHGATDVLESRTAQSILLPGTDNPRRMVHPQGMALADVVLVALEDGDRCEALIGAGKKVICIDLNPLSRTGQKSHVTIVDELTRALPALREQMVRDRKLDSIELDRRIAEYDQHAVLDASIRAIRTG